MSTPEEPLEPEGVACPQVRAAVKEAGSRAVLPRPGVVRQEEAPRARHSDAAQWLRSAWSIVRDPVERVSARDATVEFMADEDRGYYDPAWSRTSALVEAMMSRALDAVGGFLNQGGAAIRDRVRTRGGER